MNPADARPTAPEIDRHLAARLREARLRRGWSQTQVADALGLSFQQVQKYENAKNRIAAARLWQIALALGLPVAWFYEGLPTCAVARAPEMPGASRQSIELLRYFGALDDGLRRQIFVLVKVLAKAPDSATPALQIEGAHGAPPETSAQADGGAGFAPEPVPGRDPGNAEDD